MLRELPSMFMLYVLCPSCSNHHRQRFLYKHHNSHSSVSDGASWFYSGVSAYSVRPAYNAAPITKNDMSGAYSTYRKRQEVSNLTAKHNLKDLGVEGKL